MKTLYAVGAAALALALYAGPASAQNLQMQQQWCAVDSENGDVDSCVYSSLQQCLWAFNQTSGICYQDLSYQPVPSRMARPKKVRTRHS